MKLCNVEVWDEGINYLWKLAKVTVVSFLVNNKMSTFFIFFTIFFNWFVIVNLSGVKIREEDDDGLWWWVVDVVIEVGSSGGGNITMACSCSTIAFSYFRRSSPLPFDGDNKLRQSKLFSMCSSPCFYQ